MRRPCPLRLEYLEAIYPVMNRGDPREPICRFSGSQTIWGWEAPGT